MAEFPLTGITWLDIVVTIVAGSIGTTFLTSWINNRIQKRQEIVEVSKQKIESISKSKPKFVQLASYYAEIARHLGEKVEEPSWRKMFYVTGKIFLLRNCIYEEFGAIQLNNLEAEDIVNTFGREFVLRFEDLDRYLMQNLVESYPRYDMFVENISNTPSIKEKELYDRFKTILSADDV